MEYFEVPLDSRFWMVWVQTWLGSAWPCRFFLLAFLCEEITKKRDFFFFPYYFQAKMRLLLAFYFEWCGYRLDLDQLHLTDFPFWFSSVHRHFDSYDTIYILFTYYFWCVFKGNNTVYRRNYDNIILGLENLAFKYYLAERLM